jgi:hypothetical protein
MHMYAQNIDEYIHYMLSNLGKGEVFPNSAEFH